MWQAKEIKEGLRTRLIGRQVYCFDEVGSTQDMAHSLAAGGVLDGCLVIAERQTQGKGRIGKEWVSPEGGLWFSLILGSSLAPTEIPALSLLMGLGVTQSVISETNLPCLIKWPNDIWIKQKKLAGILIELSATEIEVKHILVGIGINVNIEHDLLPLRATSLEIELGRKVSRLSLLINLLERIEELYLQYQEARSLLPFLEEINELSWLNGKEVRVKGELTTAEVSSINESGQLVIKLPGGFLETIISSEMITISSLR